MAQGTLENHFINQMISSSSDSKKQNKKNIQYFKIWILIPKDSVVTDGARIFDLTITSIDVIGPQQLATEELAIHYVQHF